MLASGSSGNAALLATENTRILVDAGLSMKELRRRLAAIGEQLRRLLHLLNRKPAAEMLSRLEYLSTWGR